jgi:hypothetical protein
MSIEDKNESSQENVRLFVRVEAMLSLVVRYSFLGRIPSSLSTASFSQGFSAGASYKSKGRNIEDEY